MRRAVIAALLAALLAAAAPWRPPAATLGSDSGAVQAAKASLGLVAFAADGDALRVADGLMMAPDGPRADSLRAAVQGDISLSRSRYVAPDGTISLLESVANHGRTARTVRLRAIAYLPGDSAEPQAMGWRSRGGWKLISGLDGRLVNGWPAGPSGYPGHEPAMIGYELKLRIGPRQRRAVHLLLVPPGSRMDLTADWLSPAQRRSVVGWAWGGGGIPLSGGAPASLTQWQAWQTRLGSEALLVDSLAHAAWLARRFPGLSPLSQLNPGAFAEARAATGSGPLAGLPVAVKDIIDVAGLPTLSLAGPVPRPSAADAAIVARLRAEGAVLMGKTVFDEDFNDYGTHRLTGRLRGLVHPDLTVTGSSGGSAIAVAAGIVPLAIGSDTCGSLGTPASHAGIAAFRPTPDRIPTRGARPLNPDFDTVGPMVAEARDLPTVLAALSRTNDTAVPPAALRRLGVLRPWPADLPTPTSDVAAAFDQATERLRGAGFELVEIDLPDWPAARLSLRAAPDQSRAAMALAGWLRDRGDGQTVATLLAGGHLLASEQADLQALSNTPHSADASRARDQALARVRAALVDPMQAAGVEALILPATLARPGLLDLTRAADGEPSMCAVAALPRLPHATVPLAIGSSGLPLGLAVVGLPDHDSRLAALAANMAPILAAGRPVRPSVPPIR